MTEEHIDTAITILSGICPECMCELNAHNWMCPTQYREPVQQELFDIDSLPADKRRC
jgi:hypothetical protein